MYFTQTRSYVFNGVHLCQRYVVSNGVKQVGVFVTHSFYGVHWWTFVSIICRMLRWHYFCGALGYAHDITLLAPILSGLKYMLNICHQFAEAYGVCLIRPKASYCFLVDRTPDLVYMYLVLSLIVLLLSYWKAW